MKKIPLEHIAFPISTLLITINTFSTKSTLLASILMLIIILKNIKAIVKSKTIKELYIITGIVLAAASTGIWGNLYTNNLIKLSGLAIYSFAIIVSYRASIINSNSIVTACNAIVIVHSALFCIQLAYFFATGHYLDITNFIRDTEADTLHLTNAFAYGGIRATGAYTEPSFYAMTVLSAAACIMAFRKKITPTVIIAIITSCLSLSIAGIIISTLLLCIATLKTKGSSLAKLLLVAIALSTAPIFYSFYDERIVQAADYDAIASRLVVINEIQNRDAIENIFGAGILWDDRKPIGKSYLTGYHIRDSSFYIYILYTAGLAGLLIYLLFLYKTYKKDLFCSLLLCVTMLFKLHILHGVFWLVVVFIYISTYAHNKYSINISNS